MSLVLPSLARLDSFITLTYPVYLWDAIGTKVLYCQGDIRLTQIWQTDCYCPVHGTGLRPFPA